MLGLHDRNRLKSQAASEQITPNPRTSTDVGLATTTHAATQAESEDPSAIVARVEDSSWQITEKENSPSKKSEATNKEWDERMFSG